jgi:hypothetical protein
MTGKELSDVVCPVCSDRGPDPGPPTWDVQCGVCQWRFTDDWGIIGVPLLTAWEALQVAKKHDDKCFSASYTMLDPDSGLWARWDDWLFQDMVMETTPKSRRVKDE